MKTQTNSGMFRAGNKAGDFGRRRWPACLALLVWFGCSLARPAESAASVCATVKIEIQQSMTLERQAFDAMMRINNGLDLSLSNVTIQVNFQDATGGVVTATSNPNDTNALFFCRIDTMENITAVSNGVVDPRATAEIHWLIIPAQGAGGTNSAGLTYYVGASLSYRMLDQEETVEVEPYYILVRPMPKLALDYFLPGPVYGDDPFTLAIEENIPFPLGLRIRNTGAGPAYNLKIESAQPQITENRQGLLVGFDIVGCDVQGVASARSLLADFGTLAAGGAKVARWMMTASLMGQFTNFTASYTHANELGGELTSLIASLQAHELVKDVIVDIPGRDRVRDFLAADSGQLLVYESDSVEMPVSDRSASASLQSAGMDGDRYLYHVDIPATNEAVYVKKSFAEGRSYELVSALRADGKSLDPANVWLSKTRETGEDPWEHWLSLFDADGGGRYVVTFAAKPLTDNQAPVLAYIGNQMVALGGPVGFQVTASDPDETIPVLGAEELPAGATFEDQGDGTGIFFWQTGAGDYGVYTVRFVASDGEAEDDEMVQIYVGRPVAIPACNSTNVNVRESGEGRFFVRLDGPPTNTVMVNISRSSGSTNIWIKNGAVRSFKATSWNTWQAVVLTAAADANTTNETATFRISMAGAQDQFVTATVLDDDIGENLALPAGGSTLSGSRAYQLAQLVDGIHTSSANYGYTIWTNDPPGALTLDLQRATTLSRVRLLNWDWTYRVNRYRLEASADGVTWIDLVAEAHETDRQGWDDWAVAGDPIRYVRFTGLSGSANQCVVLSELEVYGTPQPLPALAVSKTAVNVREAGEGRVFIRLATAPAANLTVTVSRSGGDTNLWVKDNGVRLFKPANWDVWQAVTLVAGTDANADSETATFQVSAPGYVDTVVTATALDGELGENLARAAGTTIRSWRAMQAANAVDGVHTASANYAYTIWTNVPPGMLTVDLKSLKNLTRVRLLTWDWTYRVNRYRLEASADGVNWTDLAPTAQITDRQGWDDWMVSAEGVRYVRFTGLYSSANQCEALAELEIFGGSPARRGTPGKGTGTTISEPVSVLTSDGPEDGSGWNAVDSDPETAWTGQTPGGGYLVVEYAPALTLRALEVDLAAGAPSNVNYLYSQDAEEWLPLPEGLETNPVSLNFLWLMFPDSTSGAAPSVFEIRPNP